MRDWMGHFGFSYIGFIFLLMLTVPNMLWTRRKPAGYDASGESKILLVAVLAFSDYNPRTWSIWTLWLVAGATLPVAAFFLLGVYGRVIWLMISVVILGVGHIGIHLQHKRSLDQ